MCSGAPPTGQSGEVSVSPSGQRSPHRSQPTAEATEGGAAGRTLCPLQLSKSHIDPEAFQIRFTFF